MTSTPRALDSPEELLDLIRPDADLIVPIANGEPVSLIAALDANADRLDRARVHHMHALHDHPYLHGARGDQLRYVTYFLSHVSRPAFHEGGCELVPAHFSEVPMLLRRSTTDPVVLAAASPMDRHGYFSLGPCADYVASFIGAAPFILEVNPQVPRTFGRNQVHVNDVTGMIDVDRPLVEVPPAQPGELDRRIAAYVADRIPDGATLQVGIGSIPNAILDLLVDHQDLGLHTELLSDGVLQLVESGALTGARKHLCRNKMVTTFALGTAALHDFLDENAAVEFWPVDYVNDPRMIARESNIVSVNATTEVDFFGQCASETIAGRYHSGSGGQADFARGAMYAENGKGFVVLRSTTSDGEFSRIRPTLTPGSVVTTLKNTVDHVVTEYGVAELRGRTIRERTNALIAIAHPDFRDDLTREAKEMGYL